MICDHANIDKRLRELGIAVEEHQAIKDRHLQAIQEAKTFDAAWEARNNLLGESVQPQIPLSKSNLGLGLKHRVLKVYTKPRSKKRNTYRYRLNRAKTLDGDTCVYCGQEADTADHIVPRSKGGTHHIDNLAPCCFECNKTKSSDSILYFMLTQESNINARRK